MRHDDDTTLRSVNRLGDDLEDAFAREERICSAGPNPPAARRRRRRERTGRRGALVVPVLAGAALVCVASALVLSRGGRSPAPLTTEQALAEVAQSTITVPIPTFRQFLYTRSEQISAGGSRNGGRDHLGRRLGWLHSNTTTVDESWSSRGRCGLWRMREIGRDYPTKHDRELARRYASENLYFWRRANRRRRARGLSSLPKPKLPNEMAFRIPPADKSRLGDKTFTPAQLRRFPEQPQAIYEQVHLATVKRQAGSPGDAASNDMNTVADALSSDFSLYVTPAVRSGMVESLAYVAGVKSLGRMADPKGRVGYGFGLEHRGIRTTVIFDDESGYPVFRRDEVLKARKRGFYRGWPAGSVIHQKLVLERKIVDSLPRGVKPMGSPPDRRCG